MKILEEIIENLSDSNFQITSALIKTKILLHKIGRKDLSEWVNNEINGYVGKENLPEYRIIPSIVLANFESFSHRATSHPIPLHHRDQNTREALQNICIRQSLASIEKLLLSETKNFQNPIPMEFNAVLGAGLEEHFFIRNAWCSFTSHDLAQIPLQVRSRLLDFLLEIKDLIGDELTDEHIVEKISMANTSEIFNNTIFGDNTTILIGNNNHQHVDNIIKNNDFNSLKNYLKQNSVNDFDIEELRKSIEIDKNSYEISENKIGPSVKGWMKTMLSKAVDTSWNIEVGVASSILANGLQKYYGFF